MIEKFGAKCNRGVLNYITPEFVAEMKKAYENACEEMKQKSTTDAEGAKPGTTGDSTDVVMTDEVKVEGEISGTGGESEGVGVEKKWEEVLEGEFSKLVKGIESDIDEKFIEKTRISQTSLMAKKGVHGIETEFLSN